MDNISWTLFTEVYGVYGYTPFNWCVYPTCYLDLLHPFFGGSGLRVWIWDDRCMQNIFLTVA